MGQGKEEDEEREMRWERGEGGEWEKKERKGEGEEIWRSYRLILTNLRQNEIFLDIHLDTDYIHTNNSCSHSLIMNVLFSGCHNISKGRGGGKE